MRCSVVSLGGHDALTGRIDHTGTETERSGGE